MKKYHLYLDESGSFDRESNINLIGGFLMPDTPLNTRVFSKETAAEWNQDLRKNIGKAGTGIQKQNLEDGDTLHYDIFRKIESHAEEPVYIFNHCSENRSSSFRAKTQAWVLNGYIERLRQYGAVPVLFSDSGGSYLTDNNTTYLTMMAIGLCRLYARLATEASGEPAEITVHAASRKNVTLDNEPDLHKTSPFAGEEGTLDRLLYVKQMKNAAFLYGGEALLQSESYRKTLDELEIMNDHRNPETGGREPNPITVICDYICNSYYVGKRFSSDFSRELQEGCGDVYKDAYVFEVYQNNALDQYDFSIEQMAENRNWANGLIRLVSRRFPEKLSADYFSALNRTAAYNQTLCADALCNYIHSFIEDRCNMPEWIDRLNLTIEKTAALRDDIYTELKCNLMLYRITLFTHLGRQNETLQEVRNFMQTVTDVYDLERRDRLLILFANRQIVNCIDTFDYESGFRYYDASAAYFEPRKEKSEDLLLNLADIDSGLSYDVPEGAFIEYGKLKGSYAQLLTHSLHIAEGLRRQELSEKAEAFAPRIADCFRSARDLSRAYQNRCDLYAEMGLLREALADLYLASCGTDAPDKNSASEMCRVILNQSGQYGGQSAFLYLHYVRLMHIASKKDPSLFRAMLDAVRNGNPVKEALLPDYGAEVFPKATILWHLAASIASGEVSSKEKETALSLLENSVLLLRGKDSFVFTSIAIAVRAEMLALLKRELLPAPKGFFEKKLADLKTRLYEGELLKYPQKDRLFAEEMELLNGKNASAELLTQIAGKIAY